MVPARERLVEGADLNGHVGRSNDGFQRVHAGKGFGDRNAGGERVLENMEASDLALLNTFFDKKEEHLVSFKSGNDRSQIDFILVRKSEQKLVKDCKVIPGEAVVSQHRMVVSVIQVGEEVTKKRVVQRKLKIWKLKGDNIKKYRI